MDRVDVAVVGGGPAGAAAARAAAGGGAETILFEKGIPRADRKDLGPDSTDAAGILNYWVDLMALPDPFPEEFIFRQLDAAEFNGPNDQLRLTDTGISSSYPHFGFTYDRAKFDEWMLEKATDEGAECRMGRGVVSVTTSPDSNPRHRLELRSGDSVGAQHLILADGPQRTITLGVLDQFLPEDRIDRLAAPRTNHIAYQEYRQFPPELFDESTIKFWWGHMPGHTAYPWIFPNDETVARVGLTMPIGLDIDTIPHRSDYPLLRSDDESVPTGKEYIQRLLDLLYPDYEVEDFPLVTDRGKSAGTETYPISSTRPIDSPVDAGIAIVGGAMGATSAFHEGGAHVALRTGRIAGELAAKENLSQYNDEWKQAIGAEILRNVALADLVRDFSPADWDRAFRTATRLLEADRRGITLLNGVRAAGLPGLKLAAGYRRRKYQYRGGRYVQLRSTEYQL